jgi:tellurite resistance protein TerC
MLIHSLKTAKRVILIVVGFTLLAAGLVMSVPLVPGPGLLIVAGALAILAVEFVWARRLMERLKTESSRLRKRMIRKEKLKCQ